MRKAIGDVLVGIYIGAFLACLVPFALVAIVMVELLKIERQRFGFFWYNIDRALASGTWGTAEETISSEVGRIALGAGEVDGWTPGDPLEKAWAIRLAHWLNTTPAIWGVDHTKKAIQHADKLDAVDDGHEQ